MLSDLLTFVLALAVCGMAVLCVYCYRLGLRDGGFARRNGEARRRLPLRNGGGGEKESVEISGYRYCDTIRKLFLKYYRFLWERNILPMFLLLKQLHPGK